MRFTYPKHVHFRCERCALCCGDTEDKVRAILLLKTEADRVSRKTSIEIDEFAEKIKGFEPYVYRMRKTEDGKCLFLKENSCSIYQIRPLICRFYPFELKNLRNGRYAFSHTDECPGIGKGPRLTRDFFGKLFREFVKSSSALHIQARETDRIRNVSRRIGEDQKIKYSRKESADQ